MRGFAVFVLALLGLALALSPLAERTDALLLDLQWAVLRNFDARPAPDDIIIVGIDDQTAATIAEPPPLWHESLGMALVRIASARPRAIGFDLPLPERSFDDMRRGLDRALLVGLAAARDNGPFVASLSIDSRTRAARNVHAPFLALLQEERLGIALLARDVDGVTRRFSLALPTEDGSFPTLAGRLCGALSRACEDGLIHYALGAPYRYVPLQQLLKLSDVAALERLFRDRIVLVGEAQRFSGRVAAPVNLAAWEATRHDTPAIVVHAQSLRTALLRAAPREASRPLLAIVVLLAAPLALMRNWRMAAVSAVLAAAGFFVAGTLALRSGLYLPISGPLAVLAMATLLVAWRRFSSTYVVKRR
jgi:adenylate cyclase